MSKSGNYNLGEIEKRDELIQELLEACKAQHEAIDRLFALLIEKVPEFYPSKSGQPWEAVLKGNAAIAKAMGGAA